MRPKIGIALGSGGARGLAHIGVLKVFEEHQIPIDFISGSSMGSLIGALYANKIDLNMLEKLAVTLRRKHWLDLTVPKIGFIQGEKVKELIRILTHGKNIEDLAIPLAIVATDIENGERYVFNKGPVYEAVRASISIPGIFVPERVNGKLFVDGGVVERVPIQSVKDLGAEFIIAVDVGLYDAKMEVKNIFDVISQTIDIMERENYHRQIVGADYIIRPDVGHISSLSFTNVKEIIEEGYLRASQSIGEIKQLINNWEEK
ncbi:esterase [Vulcanibacillus modesticaldus]|uniref:Esterase n=1 Tax=Vulcanibacillus modesticaldus TaxID=337097 RepID=A0A1D2YXG6_9BACI|nr:patatin-like phospholipase family protein [Vulcanibacillus modesticaldus]OEG00350.1 esterase [Vulcanibacillus modesticaldus]